MNQPIDAGVSTTEPPARFPFWDWSLAVYARDGVAAACLGLQERHGLDVNLLLFGLWLAVEGRSLGEDAAAAAETLNRIATDARCWHAGVVRPLRAGRKVLKQSDFGLGTPASEAFRERVKALELEAERLEQWLLYQAAQTLPKMDVDAMSAEARGRRHLEAIRILAGAVWSELDVAACERLIASALQF